MPQEMVAYFVSVGMGLLVSLSVIVLHRSIGRKPIFKTIILLMIVSHLMAFVAGYLVHHSPVEVYIGFPVESGEMTPETH